MDNYNPQNPAYPAGMPPMNPQGYPQAQPAEVAYTNPGAPAYTAAPDPMNAYHQPTMPPAQSSPAAMSPEAMAFLSGSDMGSSKKSAKKGGGGFFGGFIGGILAVVIVGGVLFFNGAITLEDLMGTASPSDVSSQVMGLDDSVKKMEVTTTTMNTALEELTKKIEEMTTASETQTESFTKMEETVKTLSDDVDALKKGTKPSTTTPSTNSGTNTNNGGLSADDIRNLLNPPR